MAKKAAHDKHLLPIVAMVVAILAAGFGGAWYYIQNKEKQNREIAYLKVPSVAISRDGHSIRATFAVRTSEADTEWVSKNKMALEHVMKQALLDVDPVAARTPGGIRALQEKVREAGNTILQSRRIQEVLITDLLVSEGDL
jgi:flagellar basal body-associated protein FliL